jgi:hypothetical protein
MAVLVTTRDLTLQAISQNLVPAVWASRKLVESLYTNDRAVVFSRNPPWLSVRLSCRTRKYAARALVAAEQLRIKTKAVERFPLDEDGQL